MQPTSPAISAQETADLLADILLRRGNESYLGEQVTMSEHMLQAATLAEQAGEPDNVIVAALLHDIGHYTGEFGEDYLERGVDNRHENAGEAVLKDWFPDEITAVARWHVDAKRYLCAVDRDYFEALSPASVESLALQGGPMNETERAQFEDNPWFETIVKVRRFDDAAKVVDMPTPPMSHFLDITRRVLTKTRT
jgi:phosphonate degradation associated HDIG domain protein